MLPHRPRRFLSAFLIAGACAAPGHAAELGDARVASHIGQQLVADIELTLIDDPAAPVQVRVADREVYNAAGIAVPPAVSSLNLTVMRRDGRQFLHVTSLRPVDADHLHLYLELTDRGQRAVRLATLWLTPDPTPAAPPMTAPSGPVLLPTVPAPRVERPAPAPVAAHAPAPAPASAPAPDRARVVAALPMPMPMPIPMPKRLSAHAAGADTPTHAADADASADAGAAPSTPRRLPPQASIKPAPPALHETQPAACAGRSADAQACAALGAKNAELRARIGKLEARVDTLRASLGATATESTTSTAATAATAGHTAGHAASDADAAKAHGDAQPQPHGGAKEAASAHASGAKEGADDKENAGTGEKAEEGAGHDAKAAPQAAAAKEQTHDKDAAEPAPPEATAEAPKPPARPKPISSIKTLVPHKPKAAPSDDGLPWGWIAGGLGALAGAGAIGALVVSRLRKRGGDAPAKPGWLAGLRRRMRARGAASGKGAPDAGVAVAPATAE